MARALRRHFFETPETLLNELLRYPVREAVVVEDYLSGIDEDENCESEESDDDEFHGALPAIREFLLGSQALNLLKAKPREILNVRK